MAEETKQICKVEGDEIVLRISISDIERWLEVNYDAKVTNKKFYDELAEIIEDDQDGGEDFCINAFIDERMEGLLEWSENVELEGEDE